MSSPSDALNSRHSVEMPVSVETRRESLVVFRAAVVFDVADTSGTPLPSLSTFEGNPGEYLERLKLFVSQLGCSLECSKEILPAQGRCSETEAEAFALVVILAMS
jgi:hypothetical protein